MNRRDAVKATTALLGGVFVGTAGLLTACAPAGREGRGILSRDDEALIEEIADTLLPATPSSPGAKAAGVGATMNLLLTDCYTPEAQQRVMQGLDAFRSTCDERCGGDFASLARQRREQLLREIDAEAQQNADSHYFPLVRELAHGAYFSSQIGATQALRYVPVPGRFDGCIPLVPGQPAWA